MSKFEEIMSEIENGPTLDTTSLFSLTEEWMKLEALSTEALTVVEKATEEVSAWLLLAQEGPQLVNSKPLGDSLNILKENLGSQVSCLINISSLLNAPDESTNN